ncbi:MAG TPA: hypothetical protein VNI57_12895, partial [Candidatus Saccharimonadales bacterium]|nr:hypothetical protein [Candidatus Saccharimonadales bacterium]
GSKKRWRFSIPATLAASIAVAVLAYPAWLGLVELPRARGEAEAASASADQVRAEASSLRETVERGRAPRAASAENDVGLALYLDTTRGSQGEIPSVQATHGARFVPILLEPVEAGAMAEDESLRFEIRDAEGLVVWSSDTTAGAVRAGRGSPDKLLSLLVPAASLPPGAYTLTLGRPGGSGAGSLIAASFAITAP